MIFDKNGLVVDEFDSETQASVLIVECAIMDTYSNEELEGILENTYDIGKAVNEEYLEERTIVRLDKAAKKSKAEKMAVFQIAKQKGDRDFKKLLTVWKLERFLEAKLEKRYAAQAKTLAKETLKKAAQSKSKTVNRAVKKANLLLQNKK